MRGIGQYTSSGMAGGDGVEGTAEGMAVMGACGETVEAMERKKSGSWENEVE